VGPFPRDPSFFSPPLSLEFFLCPAWAQIFLYPRFACGSGFSFFPHGAFFLIPLSVDSLDVSFFFSFSLMAFLGFGGAGASFFLLRVLSWWLPSFFGIFSKGWGCFSGLPSSQDRIYSTAGIVAFFYSKGGCNGFFPHHVDSPPFCNLLDPACPLSRDFFFKGILIGGAADFPLSPLVPAILVFGS